MHTYTYTHTHTHTHAHTHCPLDKLPPALAPLFRGKTNTLRGRRTLSIQCVCVCVSGSGSRTWSTLENTHSETESWGVMKGDAACVMSRIYAYGVCVCVRACVSVCVCACTCVCVPMADLMLHVCVLLKGEHHEKMGRGGGKHQIA